MSELRKDPVIGRWVIISSDRGKRPDDFKVGDGGGSHDKCPFCPGNEKFTPPEIVAYRDEASKSPSEWQLRVIPNKYPALSVEGDLNRQGESMYDKMNGIGAHEIIIETPEHSKCISTMSDRQVESIILAYRDRIVDLKKDIRFEYILVFKNQGPHSGATLSHSHSQLIATPVVPKRVREEVNGAKNYYDYKERCVFCDIVKNELDVKTRVVCENELFVALCPFASRFPFELWMLPKKHDSQFEDIQKEEAASFASILRKVMAKIDKVLNKPSYNYLIHNSPLKESRLLHYHWHMEIMPRLTRVAGFEWGSGFYINPVAPEEAAKVLREAD
ncbi:MAG: galactose-1-phosphate uridylyltransferase [Endomicrobiales bacterium]|nr:galactose-1-phosphate uridylyltransferase [Endomicrobiales bacterium]